MSRAAVMRRAWREWRYTKMKGWDVNQFDPVTWRRCLAFSHAQERARAPSAFEALEAAAREALEREEGREAPEVALQGRREPGGFQAPPVARGESPR